jgi:hypothetical protein
MDAGKIISSSPAEIEAARLAGACHALASVDFGVYGSFQGSREALPYKTKNVAKRFIGYGEK